MLIDWFTVGAQVLNFLLLVWLMKRFLYRPILQAIDAREQRIATELADAAAKQAEAQQARDEFRHKNTAFEQQRAALLSQATDEAKEERLRLLDEARRTAESLSAKQQETLQREQQRLHDELTRRTREEVFAIVRKALTDLAGASLEERMCEVLARRLRALDNGERDDLAGVLKSASDPVVVSSAFELPAAQRGTIQAVLRETFSADIRVRFETAPPLISGIELRVNGRKVAWSIADYLEAMETRVSELLAVRPTPHAEPGPGSGSRPAAPEEGG